MRCCCKVPFMFRRREADKFSVECQIDLTYYGQKDTNNGTFTAPETAHYLVMVAATGGDIKKALRRGLGTEVGIAYLTTGQTINYNLGDNASATWDGGSVSTSKVSENELASTIVIQSLGPIEPKARIVNSFGSYQKPSTLNGWAGFPVAGVVPDAKDIDYMNTGQVFFQYWAYTEVEFPEDGMYEFGAIGDDYANLFLDGQPVMMYSDNPSRFLATQRIGASGGYTQTHVTKGKHRVYLWNLSDKCCQIHSGMYIKQMGTNKKIAASDNSTDWRYVRSPVDCLNKYDQSIVYQPPKEFVTDQPIGSPGGTNPVFENPVTPDPVNPIIPKVDDLISEPGGKPPAPNTPPPLPAYRDDGLANNP